jgi:hypothetical protein
MDIYIFMVDIHIYKYTYIIYVDLMGFINQLTQLTTQFFPCSVHTALAVGFPTGRPWASVNSARAGPAESCFSRNWWKDVEGTILNFGEHVECGFKNSFFLVVYLCVFLNFNLEMMALNTFDDVRCSNIFANYGSSSQIGILTPAGTATQR